jgi:hypothetical protein
VQEKQQQVSSDGKKHIIDDDELSALSKQFRPF